MRIAVLSDIHANLPALEAILTLARDSEEIFFCGDAVGYFANPNEVCERLQTLNVRCIRGNHDAYVTEDLTPPPKVSALARVDWTRRELTRANLAWLRSLPNEIRAQVGPLRITVRHASPWDEETYLREDSESIGTIRLGRNEVLLIGHTHRALLKRAGRGLIVNPGSVGQPRDLRGGASMALIGDSGEGARLVRAAYDVEAYRTSLLAEGWDPAVVRSLDPTCANP